MKNKALIIATITLLSTTLYADLMTSNLDSTRDNAWGVGTFTVAVDFTTGTDELSYDINKLTVQVDSSTESGSYAFYIFSDNDGTPESALSGTEFLITDPTASSDFSVENGSYTLDSGTTYWLVGTSVGGNYMGWSSTTTSDMVQEGWSIGGGSQYFVGSNPTSESSWSTWSSSTPIFSLESIPEPTTVSLLALFGAGLFVVRRKFTA